MTKFIQINLKIPQQLEDRLKKEQQRSGAYRTETIRRAIDEFLYRKEIQHKEDQK